MHDENDKNKLSRRLLLRSLGASLITASVPNWAATTPFNKSGVDSNQTAVDQKQSIKHLVLIELAGGNDGLNTVVPYSQTEYYKKRPVIGIPRDQVLTLDQHLGFHPKLEPLMKAWAKDEFHIALGVGYPNPNRSHFRSRDIWHTASGSDAVLDTGWLADQFASSHVSTEGIAFGGNYGPLAGSLKSLVLDDPAVLARQKKSLKVSDIQTNNPALAHVLAVRRQIASTLNELQSVVEKRKNRSEKVTGTELFKQLHIIADMIGEEVNVPVLKARMTGFDTHYYQPNRHKGLMEDLGKSMDALRTRLIESGHWHNTLIMTYSEFGRRAAENGSRGTDHGTAAPILLMGGAVKGGFSGAQPDFPIHKEKDLAFSMDYRQVYRSVLQSWFGMADVPQVLKGFEKVDFLKS